MIPAIKEINFPDYATLSQATVNIADMGEKTITTQIKIDGSVVPDFSFDWILEYEGEQYIHSAREPQASKENTSMRTTIDLTFKHWAVVELQRYYFVEMASTEAGTVIPNEYNASLGLDLPGFINALNNVLNHWYKGKITAVLNPAWQSSSERTYVDINYSHVWDVLQKVYDYYGVRWTIESVKDSPDTCIIQFGYNAKESTHIFQYGYEGGLLKVERQVQNTDIRNVLIGYGGDRNLPYLYFKDYAKYGNSANSDNGAFIPDPDAIPELKDIPFTKLRSAEFRSYVQGWAARHYGGTVSKSQAYVPWAWEKGYTDGTFAPVDYVKDDESIKKYGEHWGGLNDNDEIYPSIQGSGVDDIVAVDDILTDDVDASEAEAESITANVNGTTLVYGDLSAYSERELSKNNIATFTVPAGMTGVLLPTGEPQPAAYRTNAVRVENDRIHDAVTVDWSYTVHDASGSTVNPANINPGTYSVDVTVKVTNALSSTIYNVTAVVAGFSLVSSTASKGDTKGATFDVWLKNIWDTSKNQDETDKEYAERVWLPILGTADERAQLIFTTGLLAVSSDYEFTIVGIPVYDTSKSYSGGQSHWRMTLGRSQAEYKATGRLIPNTQINAVSGDKFIFTGIELPHQYILWAEQKLHDWKQDNLLETAAIQPTWVVSVDKVRANNLLTKNADGVELPGELKDTEELVKQLKVGSIIRIADERITNGVPIELHVQSATYTWNEPSEGSPYIYPDMEVVLSDKVVVATNPVAQLQGEISALQSFVGSLSNIQQIVKSVGDRLYLRKDGIADLSSSPTRFANVVTGSLFRQGSIGGRDWGFYRDNNGNAVLETDRLIVRQDLTVSNLIINQATYVGGMQINSAAAIECIEVENTEKGDYRCYFDVKQGAVANLFKVDDVAFCQRWDADTTTLKFYKRRVIEVGDDFIVLTKGYEASEENDDTGVNGFGVPEAKDNIIQYGNYTDKNRQDVIIRDVIGGGYERMLTGLNSVNASGEEYYFAGRQSSTGPRWFVGNKTENEYAEYVNGELTISGRLTVKSKIQKDDGSYVAIYEYLRGVGHRIFHEQPVPPYDVDDLWVNATYPESVEEGEEYLYNNAILRCKTAKSAYVSNLEEEVGEGEEVEEGEEVQPEPEVFSIDDWEPASGYTDDTEVKKLSYLKKALGESTVIDGGLVLTSLIQLGMTVGDTYQVYSGINGIMDESAKGKGIAAWYGGPMVDREADKDAESYAESLFRFDGSGYLSGGAITWDAEGNGSVGRDANGNPVISWDSNGVTLSDTIRLGTSDETLSSLINFMLKFDSMFELDETSIPGKKVIKAKHDGLWSEGFISALGSNPNGGGSGSGTSYELLEKWSDYSSSKSDWVLSAGLGYDLHTRLKKIEDEGVGSLASFEVIGAGNAITSVEKSADNTKLIFRKDTSFVTVSTVQEITAAKTFTSTISVLGAATFSSTVKIGGATFTWVPASGGNPGYLKLDTGFASDSFVSALGVNPGAGSAGASYLSDLLDVSISSPSAGQVLTYRNGRWIAETPQAGLDTAQLSSYLTQNGYATQNWVTGQLGNYLTASVASSTYVKKIGDTMTGALTANGGVILPYPSSTWAGMATAVPVLTAGRSNSASNTHPLIRVMSNSGNALVYGGYVDQVGFYGYTADLIAAGTNTYSFRTYWATNTGKLFHSADFQVNGAATFSSTVKIGGATFTWVPASGGNPGYLKLDTGFASDSFVSALGANPNAGDASVASYLYDLLDVNKSVVSKPSAGQVLTYRNGKWTAETPQAGLDTAQLSSYLSQNTFINKVTTSGSGNVVTAVTQSGQNITVTKGITALTAGALDGYLTSASAASTYVAKAGDTMSGALTANAGIILPATSRTWAAMVTDDNVIRIKSGAASDSSNTHPVMRIDTSGGNALVFGKYANQVGFYGWYAGSIGSTTYDFRTYWNTNTGELIHSASLSVSGATTISSTLGVTGVVTVGSTTSGTLKIGGATLTWDNANKALKIDTGFYSEKFLSALGVSSFSGETVGSASLPIYLKAGTPTACTASSLFSALSVSGTTLSITVAGQTRTATLPSGSGTTSGNYLPLTGGTLSGSLNVATSITIDSISGGAASFNLGRSGQNYIKASASGGTLLFVTNGLSGSSANSTLVLEDKDAYPGTTNTGSLGRSSYRWSNVYATTINVSSTSVVSNLNADMLDGKHASDFVSSSSLTDGSVTKVGTSSKGSTSLPIYLSNGTPTACTASSLFSALSVSGTTLSITVAGQTRTATLPSGGGTTSGNYLPLTGGTLSGSLNVATSITIDSISGGAASFNLGRSGQNYIKASASGGTLLFVTNGLSGSSANSTMILDGKNVYPGASNTGTLGTSDKYWKAVYSAAFTNASDGRLKNILSSINLRVQDIANAPTVEFVWRSNGVRSYGTIAQYWRGINPVFVDGDEILSIQYGNLALVSVVSVAREVVSVKRKVSEHDREIAELKRENASLRESNEELRKEVELLKAA